MALAWDYDNDDKWWWRWQILSLIMIDDDDNDAKHHWNFNVIQMTICPLPLMMPPLGSVYAVNFTCFCKTFFP